MGSDELAEQPSELGLGRVGALARPISLRDFAGRVARALPATPAGIRVGGDLDRPVQRIAVLAGAGDSLLDAARASGADVYVTSDLRHHPASEALAWPGAPALIDIPHWAAEWLWLPALQRRLSAAVIAPRSRVPSRCPRSSPIRGRSTWPSSLSAPYQRWPRSPLAPALPRARAPARHLRRLPLDTSACFRSTPPPEERVSAPQLFLNRESGCR